MTTVDIELTEEELAQVYGGMLEDEVIAECEEQIIEASMVM